MNQSLTLGHAASYPAPADDADLIRRGILPRPEFSVCDRCEMPRTCRDMRHCSGPSPAVDPLVEWRQEMDALINSMSVEGPWRETMLARLDRVIAVRS